MFYKLVTGWWLHFSLMYLNDGNGICYNLESDGFNALDISKEGCFSILYMNSRSLCRHFYDIQDYLSSLTHSFSIYGFSETWFRESPPPYITMADYNLVHSSRSNKIGGGVAIFVNNSLFAMISCLLLMVMSVCS